MSNSLAHWLKLFSGDRQTRVRGVTRAAITYIAHRCVDSDAWDVWAGPRQMNKAQLRSKLRAIREFENSEGRNPPCCM